jgi:hypothetical protein
MKFMNPKAAYGRLERVAHSLHARAGRMPGGWLCRILVLLCAGHAGWAQAEIYKHVDAEGNVTYTSTPMKGAKKLDLTPPMTSSSPPSRPRGDTSAASFPKVDSATQKSRDGARQRILMDELAAEEKLLAEARKNLKEGEDSMAALAGKEGANRARQEEKIRTLLEQVALHEKNVSALKIELSALK